MTEQKDEIRLKELLSVFGKDKQKELIEILHRDQIRYHKEQLLIHGVVSSLPTSKEISIQAENYAYKIFKNFKRHEQVLMKRAYQRGCYWMRKKINK